MPGRAFLPAFGFVLAGLAPGPVAAQCAAAIAPADRRGAVEDMSLPSEAVPLNLEGVPYGNEWMQRGRVASGNEPGDLGSIMPWSVILPAPENRVPEARVELRNMKLLLLSRKSMTWRELVSSDALRGRHFSKDIGKSISFEPLDIAHGDDSSRMVVDSRYMAHFWPAKGARRKIDPTDVAGVYVSVEARMDEEDFAAGARFLMDAAADYWRSNDAKRDGWKNNRDAGIGRLKMLEPEWRTFYMTTADAAGLEMCWESSR